MRSNVGMTGSSSPRIAMIGSGFMAQVHTRGAIASGAERVVLASSSQERAEQSATELGYGRAAADPLEAITADDVDVVHICSPNASHVEFATAALQAGKHVICEKPIATSSADARTLADLAGSSGLVATVPFVYRFHPMAREVAARSRHSEFGNLLNFHGLYLQDWLLDGTDDNWRVDAAVGGRSRAFADVGSHLVDLFEFVTGDTIHRVAARKRIVHTSRAGRASVATEDAVAVAVETTGGAIGTLLVSQVSPGRKNQLALELAGSRESIRFEQEEPDSIWIGRRSGSGILPRDPAQLISPDAQRLSILPAGHPLGYQDAFTAFIRDSYAAMQGAQPKGLPRFSDGARAAQITDAVIDSVDSDGWIEISHDSTTGASQGTPHEKAQQ